MLKFDRIFVTLHLKKGRSLEELLGYKVFLLIVQSGQMLLSTCIENFKRNIITIHD